MVCAGNNGGPGLKGGSNHGSLHTFVFRVQKTVVIVRGVVSEGEKKNEINAWTARKKLHVCAVGRCRRKGDH